LGGIADELWREAVADSGLDEAQLHRFEAVRAVMEGAGAQWWAPGTPVHEPPVRLELSEDDAAAADSLPLIEKHRVATVPIEGLEPAVAEATIAAMLRHELEHARQWEAAGGPEAFMLMQLAWKVYMRKTGGTMHGGFLTQMPIEDDANAAASLFLRRVRPDVVDDLAQHDVYQTLVRAIVGPASPESLVVRMVGFLFQYRHVVQDLTAESGPISETTYIGFYARSGVEVWQALCDAVDAAEQSRS
jgi:hypothetical protein